MLKCKVYLSDEGFGHLVRQEAIIKSMLRLNNKIHFTIQTKNKFKFAVEKFSNYKNISYIEKFNNIETVKNIDGSLNLQKTRYYFDNYLNNSETFILEELKDFNYDFVISDAVPEAHQIAKIAKVPSFLIFHFNWAWFCKKVFPDLNDVSSHMLKMYKHASLTFLPPLEPLETTVNFKDNGTNVPFIINDFDNFDIVQTKKKKILIMDNGTSTLSKIIISNFDKFESLNDYHFYIPKNLAKADASNITRVEGVKRIHSHIPKMDAIVARAGYNTLTECIISKVPALFVNETKNPEIAHNISQVFSLGLGGKMTVKNYQDNFVNCFESFMKTDYDNIKKNLNSANFEKNGAEVISKKILNYLGKL
jgi:uncharacterized protein (TIGR00661 family)|tara:strand:- start:26755 stop:27846 length:1092 start_codon:yes stop_codon:yes gene_type:complete